MAQRPLSADIEYADLRDLDVESVRRGWARAAHALEAELEEAHERNQRLTQELDRERTLRLAAQHEASTDHKAELGDEPHAYTRCEDPTQASDPPRGIFSRLFSRIPPEALEPREGGGRIPLTDDCEACDGSGLQAYHPTRSTYPDTWCTVCGGSGKQSIQLDPPLRRDPMHAAMDELATLLECDRAHVVELVREYVEVQKRVFKCVTREQERADRAEVACGVLLTKIRSARDYAANAPRDLISRREVEIILAILKLEA